MNIADKIAKANIVAAYLVDTDNDLAGELASRGLSELATDAEFQHVFAERAFPCRECGYWELVETVLNHDLDPEEKCCCECSDGGDDYDY